MSDCLFIAQFNIIHRSGILTALFDYLVLTLRSKRLVYLCLKRDALCHGPLTCTSCPVCSRPMDRVERRELRAFLKRETHELHLLLQESYQLSYHDCEDGPDCMMLVDLPPRYVVICSGLHGGSTSSVRWTIVRTAWSWWIYTSRVRSTIVGTV